jgi:hypothetical protein
MDSGKAHFLKTLSKSLRLRIRQRWTEDGMQNWELATKRGLTAEKRSKENIGIFLRKCFGLFFDVIALLPNSV